MDLLTQAIQMEIDGEHFYRDLAAKAEDPGVKIILTKLADDEIKHRQLFEHMQKDKTVQYVPNNIVDAKSNAFADMKKMTKISEEFKKSIVDALQKAQAVETKNHGFYLKQAEAETNPDYKKVILKIAEEEDQHAAIMLDLIEYFLNPKQWLEDAEWNHRDQY